MALTVNNTNTYSPNYTGEKYVRIFKNNNDKWEQIGNDLETTSTGNIEAISLSSDGSIIAIGGPYINRGHDYNQKYVRVYQNQNNSWVQLGSDINGNLFGDGTFGNSLQLSDDGKVLLIGINDFPRSAF